MRGFAVRGGSGPECWWSLFVLDENIDSLDMLLLLRGKADLAMDVVNLKISKLGGLTKTKQPPATSALRWELPFAVL